MRMKPSLPVNTDKQLEIMIIGEAPGSDEELHGKPFVGSAGELLNKMLSQAKIAREDCYLTNVFFERPSGNNVENFCVKKKEAEELWQENNTGKYPYPYLKRGKYLKPEYCHELERLKDEIMEWKPNLIIALGNTPLWALTGESGITRYRGTVVEVEVRGHKFKMLPTYHPAYILRKYDDKPVAIIDLKKAKRESLTPELIKFERELWIEPTIDDIKKFRDEVMRQADYIACDIETTAHANGQITCIGFGTTTQAICIPFMDVHEGDYNYWSDPLDEFKALCLVDQMLTMGVDLVGQNFMYDMAWLWRKWGMTPKNCEIHDSMLLHHSMYCELQKGLGFLGSVYTNEVAWKNLTVKTNKKDA